MASTKTIALNATNVALTCSATGSQTAVANLSTGYGSLLFLSMTTSGTIPYNLPSASIMLSADNSVFYMYGGAVVCTSASNCTSSYCVPLSIGASYCYVVVGGNTGANIVYNCQINNITKI